MIHLLVSSKHLLCVQWKDENSKSLLTGFSYQPFKAKKTSSVFSPKESILDINAALKAAKKALSFEGEKIFVTVPDDFCDSVLTQCDEDMSDADGWEYSKWSIKQRNVASDDSAYEYFGRSFIPETKSIFSLRISSVLTESLKMTIQEMGGEPVWMGTESSAYYGLNKTRGITLFVNDKNGYNYYHYSKNCFLKGSAKFAKNKWSLSSTDGSSNEQDIFKGQIVIPGKLSYRRKAHFEGKRIRQVEAFKNIKKNDIKIPKEVKNNDLYIATAIINGKANESSINFFNNPGLQQINEDKPIPQIDESKPKNKARKALPPKKQRNFQQFFAYVFFFAALTAVIFRDRLPELLEIAEEKVFAFIDAAPDLIETIPVVEDDPVPYYSDFQQKSFYRSQSLIASLVKVNTLISMEKLTSIDASKGVYEIIFNDTKETDEPIDTLGSLLNYSLRQVSGVDRYQHGYLIQYPIDLINKDFMGSYTPMDQLKSELTDFADIQIKAFDVFTENTLEHTPFLFSVSNINEINSMLTYLENKGSDIILEKFQMTSNEPGSLTARFFITYINYSDS